MDQKISFFVAADRDGKFCAVVTGPNGFHKEGRPKSTIEEAIDDAEEAHRLALQGLGSKVTRIVRHNYC